MIAGALQTPVLFGHLAYQEAFGGGGGLVLVDQLVQEQIELVLVFPRKDQACRRESVGEGVLGRDGFSFQGAGTAL